MKVAAPKSDGHNFIQNIPPPNTLVSHAKTDNIGGTSIKPKAR